MLFCMFGYKFYLSLIEMHTVIPFCGLLYLSAVGFLSVGSDRLHAFEYKSINETPYAAIVLFNVTKFFCSGTILNESWVLTSAHCLYDTSGIFREYDTSVTVIAGTDTLHYAPADVQSGNVQIRKSRKVVIHNSYTWSENFINDLALIHLTAPFNLSQRVGVAPPLGAAGINDPQKQTLDTPLNCEGYGFGKKSRNDDGSDVRLKMQHYQAGKQCNCLRRIRSSRSPYNVVNKRNIFICDELDTDSGLCDGDNGGQLICGGKLRGIATTIFHFNDKMWCQITEGEDQECGDRRALSVFTDLCYFSQFIHRFLPGYPVTDEYCNVMYDVPQSFSTE